MEEKRMIKQEERSPATVEKYMRDLRGFSAWLEGRAVTKRLAAGWKQELLDQGLSPGLDGFHRDIPHLTDPDAGGADRLDNQRQLLPPQLLGGVQQTAVVLPEAVPEAGQICPERKNRLRRDISHQTRNRSFTLCDLAGDESPLRESGGCPLEGLPPQPAAPVRHRLLSGDPGHRQAGRSSGPQSITRKNLLISRGKICYNAMR